MKRARQKAGKKGARKEEIQSKLDLALDIKSSMGGKGSEARAVKDIGEVF